MGTSAPDTDRITVSFPHDMAERLAECAALQYIPVSALVRQLVAAYLAKVANDDSR